MGLLGSLAFFRGRSQRMAQSGDQSVCQESLLSQNELVVQVLWVIVYGMIWFLDFEEFSSTCLVEGEWKWEI
jgi:hypothetical protein